MHSKIVILVEQMIEAKKILQTARMDKDKNYYQDSRIALAPDEIKIFEGN